MRNPITIGLGIGLLFGLVLVWRDASAAGLVLLFAFIGLLIGSIIWFGARVASGDLDLTALRELIATVASGHTHR